MRSLWLGTAAVIVTAGLAFAQTNTSTPAPTGAISAPVQTNPGLAPGKTAPPATQSTESMTPTMSSSTSSMSNSMATNAPAPQGSIQAPVENGPNMSPGKTAPNDGTVRPGMSASPASYSSGYSSGTHNGWQSSHSGSSALPPNGSAESYLHIAARAIQNHDHGLAEEALAHAETRLLTREVPQSPTIPADHSPAVASIEQARHDLSAGQYDAASHSTDMALQAANTAPASTRSNMAPMGAPGVP